MSCGRAHALVQGLSGDVVVLADAVAWAEVSHLKCTGMLPTHPVSYDVSFVAALVSLNLRIHVFSSFFAIKLVLN